jgi:hypothetical protein
MKIQEASENFTEGGILFPSSRTFYLKENTSIGDENRHFSIDFELKRPSAQDGAPSVELCHKRPGVCRGAPGNLR